MDWVSGKKKGSEVADSLRGRTEKREGKKLHRKFSQERTAENKMCDGMNMSQQIPSIYTTVMYQLKKYWKKSVLWDVQCELFSTFHTTASMESLLLMHLLVWVESLGGDLEELLSSVSGLARDECGDKLRKHKNQKLDDIQVSCEKDVLSTTQFEL